MEFKRAASAVCALALVFGMAAAPAADGVFRKASPVVVASADNELTYGDFKYTVNDGTVTITKYTGSATELTIPATIDGKSVTAIGEDAFCDCTSLTSVTIPKSVTTIGDYAFAGCSSLTSIDVDDDNTTFTSYNGVLYNKDKTKLICCPTGKTSITIPNSVTDIGNRAFAGCSSMTSISIPNSVTNIGEWVFSDCTGLTSISIPNGVMIIGECAFYDCTSMTSISISDSVTSIGDSAFHRCTSLTSVTIPKSVTSIGDYAFGGCSNLTSIDIDSGNALYSSYDGVLYNKDKTELICCPEGKKSINIPNSVTSIGASSFSYCTNLTSIAIPNSVTSIGDWAFSDCTSLTSITIPNSVTNIGDWAFKWCASLTSITIPNSVTNISYEAFYGCTSLTNITIPDSVTSISGYSFYNCTSLISITIPASVTSIDDGVFEECTSLKDVEYSGTETQWKAISIGDFNGPLLDATIHCTDGTINEKPDDSTDSTDSSSGSDDSSKTDPAPAKKSISKAKVKAANKVYTGKALTPAVTVTLDGKTLKNGTDYTVSYKNNKKCGKAKVTVTGKGNYTGSKSGSFIIKPAKVAAKKLTSPKKNTIKLTWTKTKGGVTGYQVMTATNKKFSNGKKTYNVKAAAASKTVKSLKSKKTYYAKVRAFKKVDGKNYFGAWSKIKKVKCK